MDPTSISTTPTRTDSDAGGADGATGRRRAAVAAGLIVSAATGATVAAMATTGAGLLAFKIVGSNHNESLVPSPEVAGAV